MSKAKLIQGLNEDLAHELGTVLRYTYQAGHCFGNFAMGVRAMLHEEAIEELGHATFLTDAIVDLGGEPTTVPSEFPKEKNLKAMLELDLKMEEADVARYTRHAELAGELGEVDLKLKLEEMAADEAGHARKLRRILRGL